MRGEKIGAGRVSFDGFIGVSGREASGDSPGALGTGLCLRGLPR